MQDLNNFRKAYDEAGYAQFDPADYIAVFECPRCFVLLTTDGFGEYIVGRFIKPTASRRGDYTGVGDYHGEDLSEARKCFAEQVTHQLNT